MAIPNISGRRVVQEEHTSKGCYRLEYIHTKNKKDPSKPYGPYGPYWYFYYYKDGALVSKYIGKELLFKVHAKKAKQEDLPMLNKIMNEGSDYESKDGV